MSQSLTYKIGYFAIDWVNKIITLKYVEKHCLFAEYNLEGSRYNLAHINLKQTFSFIITSSGMMGRFMLHI